MSEQLIIFDTTLRDGEQSPGASMTKDEKLRIARQLERLKVDFPEVAAEQLRRHVQRFLRLWSRNQWKRERYAPSFHLDDKNLDPKTWCRFPILSGGFAAELDAL